MDFLNLFLTEILYDVVFTFLAEQRLELDHKKE